MRRQAEKDPALQLGTSKHGSQELSHPNQWKLVEFWYINKESVGEQIGEAYSTLYNM